MLRVPVKVVDSAARLGLSGAVTSSASRVVLLPTSAVPAGARGVLGGVGGRREHGRVGVGRVLRVGPPLSFAHGQSAHEVVLMPLVSTGAVSFRSASLGTRLRGLGAGVRGLTQGRRCRRADLD